VQKVVEAASGQEAEILLDDKARNFLVEKGFDPVYGARPMRRAVERYLEDPLAEEILRGHLHQNDPIQVSAEAGQVGLQPGDDGRGRALELDDSGAVVNRPAILVRRGVVEEKD
jgi:ATP-dependent Clp protease ATP-binding subunit ClpA